MPGSATGALKTAAARTRTPDYASRVARGEKWCIRCRAWHSRDAFGSDRHRTDGLATACRESKNAEQRMRYAVSILSREPHPRKGHHGPPAAPPRNGDKLQARARVNVLVRTGRLPHPSTLPCVDCGHVWQPGERRHEYDHYRGYVAEHHLDVEAVCTTCHCVRHTQEAAV